MAALVALAVVYIVIVSNQVSSGKQQIADMRTRSCRPSSRRPSSSPTRTSPRRRRVAATAVTTIAKARFNWDRSLTELAKVSPGDVWLTSAKGTLTATTAVSGGAAGSDTGALRGFMPGPALELAGCGKREGDVPKYMDRLYSLSGVAEVGFSKIERARSGGRTERCRLVEPHAARRRLPRSRW